MTPFGFLKRFQLFRACLKIYPLLRKRCPEHTIIQLNWNKIVKKVQYHTMQNFQLSRDSHMGGYKNKRIKRPKNPRPLLHSIHNYTFNKKNLLRLFSAATPVSSLIWLLLTRKARGISISVNEYKTCKSPDVNNTVISQWTGEAYLYVSTPIGKLNEIGFWVQAYRAIPGWPLSWFSAPMCIWVRAVQNKWTLLGRTPISVLIAVPFVASQKRNTPTS